MSQQHDSLDPWFCFFSFDSMSQESLPQQQPLPAAWFSMLLFVFRSHESAPQQQQQCSFASLAVAPSFFMKHESLWQQHESIEHEAVSVFFFWSVWVKPCAALMTDIINRIPSSTIQILLLRCFISLPFKKIVKGVGLKHNNAQKNRSRQSVQRQLIFKSGIHSNEGRSDHD